MSSDEAIWPAQCKDPDSCARHKRCMYHGCVWATLPLTNLVEMMRVAEESRERPASIPFKLKLREDRMATIEEHRALREELKNWQDSSEAYRLDAEAACAMRYPEELTGPLREVLGLMVFETGPVAHIFRAGGAAIDQKVEAEQAYVLHWLIGLVLKHGEGWREMANAELKARRAAPS